MKTCSKCNEQNEDNYCPKCGTPFHVKRIDRKYILHEMEHSILHLENGIFYTIKELIVNPGNTIRNFINGEREKHFKPLGFLIITSVIYGFISHYMGFEKIENSGETNTILINWIENHNNYANVILIAFIAFSLRFVFYRKADYNIFEYFILMAFITGEIMVMGVFAEILSGIIHSEIPGDIYLLITFLYGSWVIGKFFKVKNIGGYLKAFLVYFTCICFFIITVMIADELIVIFHK